MLSKLNINKKLNIMLNNKASAKAIIKGSKEYPKIRGIVFFHETPNEVLVTANIKGLPHTENICSTRIFAFHIHEGLCSGTAKDPFANVGQHYNPNNCNHPNHAGDLPPLFENQGEAFMTFLTQRFTTEEIVGRTVIIHDSPDDFTSQPSGNSGAKIACGVIKTF